MLRIAEPIDADALTSLPFLPAMEYPHLDAVCRLTIRVDCAKWGKTTKRK